MAIDATLTRVEKNLVFQLVEGRHFDPSEFEWTEDVKQEHTDYTAFVYRRSVLTHRPTRYYFVFGGTSFVFSPGRRHKVENEDRPDDSDRRYELVWYWLGRVRRECDEPDLWASVGQERVLATAASSATLDNRLFTPDERQQVASRLDEIKAYILEGQTFDAQQAEFMERQFIYLRDASQRLGRKDWLNILLASLLSLALTLALPPEKVRSLLALAGTALQWLWGVPQDLLR